MLNDELVPEDSWESKEGGFTFNQGDDIRITLADDVIIGAPISPEERLFNYSSQIMVFNGVIAGYDYGELGGKISHIPDNGHEYTLINENFKGFCAISDKVFVLTGISHMFTDNGHLHELDYDSGKWFAAQILDLGSCPESYLLLGKTLYLATNKAFLVVEDRKIVQKIPMEESWAGLYPNSLILANSKLYVGIRGGMISVGLDDRKITWYTPIPK